MILSLPMPPSLNNAFATVTIGGKQRRVKSREYGAWERTAIKRLGDYGITPPARPYGVHIRLNMGRRGDIDNRVKPVLDALVKAGVICGDQWVDDCRVTRDPSVIGCQVELWGAETLL